MLFDQLDDPRQMGLLQLGLGLLGGKGNFGQVVSQAGNQSLQAMQMAADRQRQKTRDERQERLLGIQEQQANIALQDAQKRQTTDALMEGLARHHARAGVRPESMDDRDVGQPGEPAIPRQFDYAGYANDLAGIDPIKSLQLQSMLKKDDKPIVSKPGDIARDASGRLLWQNPAEPKEQPSAVREYEFARSQGYKGTFQQFELDKRKAGATNVSVSTGQKGFDNTLKLRGDFRSEPIYKAHQEVQSAHSQIKQSLAQKSPAGDLAGATKIMKILDPGSVVRESELGMAMQATGLLDRVGNYADMIIKGTKLTPAQRADFQKLADALFNESTKQYNAKRQEYQGIAKRNGLNELDVLGPESAAPSSNVVDWSNLK